ncbi:MAG TPA: NmrA family NAD(P)-binding protein, partial [Anaerolineaceae bacterium]|nr:NmrA family NAD(P)-binding protein [Anaerolineaceae bacterium]
MNILIIGGTGMLGLPFTQNLLSEGDHVTILTRNPQKAVVPSGAQVAAWDGRSADGWVAQVEQADVLVNL